MVDREPKQAFVIELECRPGAAGVRQLRCMLKVLLRQWGFKCRSIKPTTTTTNSEDDHATT
jgi:hypothetical protein